MNKLFTATVAITLLAISYTSHSQTDATAVKTPISLEDQYQNELDKWMLQAYEGDRDAQFKVGVLFTNDQFQSADLEQSAYWYKQSARQGHALAQYNLGHQYLTGNGVKRSEAEAMKWWLKAAEQDHPLAQFNVGRAYYLGIGLNQDHSQSRLWFKRAAKNNEPKSIDILEQLGWAEEGEYKNVVNADPAASSVANQASETKPPASLVQVEIQEPAIEELVSVDEPEQQPEQQTTQEQAAADQVNPIAVYTNPAKRSVLIAILDVRKQLNVVSATPEWTEVTSENGFPVWVHQNYIVVADDIGTIQGDAVNARSVPLITSGTIVDRLNDNETLAVLDKKNAWYRVMSPSRFKAWVKTDEFNRKESPKTIQSETPETTENVDQIVRSIQVRTEAQTTPPSISASDNNNDWLFSQSADSYTLQLASFEDPDKIAEFRSRKKFVNNPNLHGFTSNSKNIAWTYFLYGEFESSDAAKEAREEIKQKLAWVRSFGKLQQNRCVSWKKQIPTPRELNKYCSPNSSNG